MEGERMKLFEDMRIVQGRNTRGDVKPIYFLLHPSDYQTCKNFIFAERDRGAGLGYQVLAFNGCPLMEWEACEEGKPLVVMG